MRVSAGENDGRVVNLVDQVMIGGDLNELVDHHRGIGWCRTQQMVEQRRLAGRRENQ